MTLHYTTNYHLAWADTDTALTDIAVVTQQVAASVDAALTAGGITPPAASDAVTMAAAIAKLKPTAWATLPMIGGTVFVHDDPTGAPVQYRIVAGARVVMRGWGKVPAGGAAAAGAYLWSALPAACWPDRACSAWPVKGTGVNRLDIDVADGRGKTIGALAAGDFLNFATCTWDIPAW